MKIRAGARGHRRAFSLIELLVVIAIVTVLAAILLPALTQMKERTYQVVCLNNMRQLAIGSTVCANNNKGRFPYAEIQYATTLEWMGRVRWFDTAMGITAYLDQMWGIQTWAFNNYTRPPPGKYLTNYEVFYCPGWMRHRPGDKDYQMLNSNLQYLPNLELVFGVCREVAGPRANTNHKIGYAVFSGGLIPSEAALAGSEVPRRVVPGKKRLSFSSPALCWLFADLYGFSAARTPHHVGMYNAITLPFNVVHLDGHADIHQWDMDYEPSGDYMKKWGGGVPYGNTGGDGTPAVQETGYDTDNDRRGR
ncbi:type II secretion system protein [Planctomycetota bacterium]